MGTALLMALILAIGDQNNNAGGATWTALAVAFAVMAIGISLGTMHGYAINPARDLGPRIFSAIAGFQHNGLTDGTNIWIVPVVGPIVGALVGAFIYDGVIGNVLKRAKAAQQAKMKAA